MRVAMLSGGVGGARMAAGFDALDEVELTVIVNVGDDEDVHGLRVCPDLDTVVYTLAGIQGPEGWGRVDETWQVMSELERFPADTSFRLGDRDLATNLFRTGSLAAGRALSSVTADVCRAFGVRSTVLPASDDPVRTRVRVTGTGEWLDFQTYFVRRRHRDPIDRVSFEGAAAARPGPGVLEAIASCDLVVVGPSNPILSIRPLLAVGPVEETLRAKGRVAAVSPLIGGEALKGPAAAVLTSLGHPVGNPGVIDAYGGLVTHLVVDRADAGERLEGVEVLATDTRIPTREAAARLAREVVAWLG